MKEPAAAASAAELSLRNLVESYAQNAGVEFLPKARQHEGLQVRSMRVSCLLRDMPCDMQLLVGDMCLH